MLVEDLALAGRPVTLDDQNLYVFRGLRPELRPLGAPLTRGAPVTLTELSDYLVSQEFICADDGGALVAMAARRGRGGRGAGGQSRGNSDSGGGGRGRHGRGRGRGRNQTVRCQLCNSQGHSALSCFRLSQYASNPSPQAHMAYSAGDGGSDGPHQWFPDTGATNHVTPDASVLSSATPYYGSDTLRVGNGIGPAPEVPWGVAPVPLSHPVTADDSDDVVEPPVVDSDVVGCGATDSERTVTAPVRGRSRRAARLLCPGLM
ncbi:PREDICTED: protein argonaute 2-like [Ipomoea nil]|uniref:protein argonaute 2-like n=1 Tax=Ipomoea nil TaxID=35883 RepID=UPI000900F7F2|nr:PREDICTED: protein argonaute 2-like [Ipomoea nil]